MNQTDSINRELLVKADIYRLLTLAFSYPDSEAFEALKSISGDTDNSTVPLECREEFKALTDSAAALTAAEIEGEFSELFMTRMYCPPYETSYEKHGFSRPETLADISAFYKAFGFSISGGEEMLDHIAVEMEFMSLLMLKESYADEQGLGDMTEICDSAKKKFLAEHMGRWAGVFLRNLKSRTKMDFYRNAADFAEKFLEGEIKHYGLEVQYCDGAVKDEVTDEPIICPVHEKLTE